MTPIGENHYYKKNNKDVTLYISKSWKNLPFGESLCGDSVCSYFVKIKKSKVY